MAHLDFTTIVNIAAPRLIRFLITFNLYLFFTLIGFNERGSILATVLICLPMLSLWIFVMDSVPEKFDRYTKLILLGTFFSFSGDILFNYELIKSGMASYAVATICYTSAFGFQPVRPWLGIPFYTWGSVTVALMFNHFSTMDKIYFPFYCTLLMTMCWRAHARIDSTRNIVRMACGIGSMLYALSRFIPFNNSKWFMITYYVAQLGITLSVIDREVL